MRVVIDSNVLARATPGKTSAAREVLLLAAKEPHQVITSAALLTELVNAIILRGVSMHILRNGMLSDTFHNVRRKEA